MYSGITNDKQHEIYAFLVKVLTKLLQLVDIKRVHIPHDNSQLNNELRKEQNYCFIIEYFKYFGVRKIKICYAYVSNLEELIRRHYIPTNYRQKHWIYYTQHKNNPVLQPLHDSEFKKRLV